MDDDSYRTIPCTLLLKEVLTGYLLTVWSQQELLVVESLTHLLPTVHHSHSLVQVSLSSTQHTHTTIASDRAVCR